MHDFVGKWRITSMSNWAQDVIDLDEPGHFLFEKDGLGRLVFIAVRGWLDVRVSSRRPFLEYSWQGTDDRDEACGRGWFEFETPDLGEGMFFFHNGDESTVTIKREI